MEDLAVFTTLNHSGYLGKNFIQIKKKKLCYFPAKGRSVQRKTVTEALPTASGSIFKTQVQFFTIRTSQPKQHILMPYYRNLDRNRFSPMWYVANLAFADLLFTFLTLFHAINFSWRQVGGDVIYKVHAFLVDTSYNTSITTLVVIAFLRLKAITDIFNSRSDNFSNRQYVKLVLTWCMCLVISSPTANIIKVETNSDGKLICANTSWGSTGREIYYTVHAILFFHN